MKEQPLKGSRLNRLLVEGLRSREDAPIPETRTRENWKNNKHPVVHRDKKTGKFLKGHRHFTEEWRRNFSNSIMGNTFALGHRKSEASKQLISRQTRKALQAKIRELGHFRNIRTWKLSDEERERHSQRMKSYCSQLTEEERKQRTKAAIKARCDN